MKRAWVVLGLLAAAGAIAVAGRLFLPTSASARATLPHIAPMPAFALRDQTGASFTDASVRGRVWVADFVFTRCTSSCPTLTARMHHLQARLQDVERRRGRPVDVRLMSLSVDPENDTPPVLAAYAAKSGADPRLWVFLTGDASAMQNVTVAGFKMAAQRVEKGAGEYDVLHGNWFVLGDRAGTIRGYYEVKETSQVDALADDVLRLEQEARP